MQSESGKHTNTVEDTLQKLFSEPMRELLDTRDFDPVVFINETFSEEAAQQDGRFTNHISLQKNCLEQLSKEVVDDIHKHAEQTSSTEAELNHALEVGQTLQDELEHLQNSAEMSIQCSQELYDAVSVLGVAKKNVQSCITSLRNFYDLLEGAIRIDELSEREEFISAAQLLLDILNLANDFTDYKDLEKVRKALEYCSKQRKTQLDKILNSLRKQYNRDVDKFTNQTILMFHDSCIALDMIDTNESEIFFTSFLQFFLEPCERLFNITTNANGDLENTEAITLIESIPRKYTYIRREIKRQYIKYNEIFPSSWNFSQRIFQSLSNTIKTHLNILIRYLYKHCTRDYLLKNGVFDDSCMLKFQYINNKQILDGEYGDRSHIPIYYQENNKIISNDNNTTSTNIANNDTPWNSSSMMRVFTPTTYLSNTSTSLLASNISTLWTDTLHVLGDTVGVDEKKNNTNMNRSSTSSTVNPTNTSTTVDSQLITLSTVYQKSCEFELEILHNLFKTVVDTTSSSQILQEEKDIIGVIESFDERQQILSSLFHTIIHPYLYGLILLQRIQLRDSFSSFIQNDIQHIEYIQQDGELSYKQNRQQSSDTLLLHLKKQFANAFQYYPLYIFLSLIDEGLYSLRLYTQYLSTLKIRYIGWFKEEPHIRTINSTNTMEPTIESRCSINTLSANSNNRYIAFSVIALCTVVCTAEYVLDIIPGLLRSLRGKKEILSEHSNQEEREETMIAYQEKQYKQIEISRINEIITIDYKHEEMEQEQQETIINILNDTIKAIVDIFIGKIKNYLESDTWKQLRGAGEESPYIIQITQLLPEIASQYHSFLSLKYYQHSILEQVQTFIRELHTMLLNLSIPITVIQGQQLSIDMLSLHTLCNELPFYQRNQIGYVYNIKNVDNSEKLSNVFIRLYSRIVSEALQDLEKTTKIFTCSPQILIHVFVSLYGVSSYERFQDHIKVMDIPHVDRENYLREYRALRGSILS